jgi:phosphatidylglycerol:prolipoprotein diacylglycerol transferase
MYPEICTIGPFTVYSYGLMLAVAFTVTCTLLVIQARKQGLDSDIIFNLAFIVFLCGIIGARVFYVLDNLPYYLKHPAEIVKLQHGGLAWLGGLMGGILAGVVYLKKKKLPILKVMDLIVPFAALGQAIGRIGCLLNGCCFGRESLFGIYFPVHEAIRIPVQIYSSLILIAIYVFLRFMQERPHRQRQIFYVYLLLYASKRFLIEFWRADNAVIFLGLTLFQVSSVLIFVFALTQLTFLKRTRTKALP